MTNNTAFETFRLCEMAWHNLYGVANSDYTICNQKWYKEGLKSAYTRLCYFVFFAKKLSNPI